MSARLHALGEGCLLVELGTAIDDAVNARVLDLDARIARERWPGVVETVPAYASLALVIDPARADAIPERVQRALESAPDIEEPRGGEECPIPVCYGGAHGPDLGEVAAYAGLAPDEVVARHAAATYRCHMVGFTPGFPYLAGLDPALACPRLPEPRLAVPAGSVGIADRQTGIYPSETPGGWRLVGRTPLALFDALRPEPALVTPGATVRFVPIDAQEFDRLAAFQISDRDRVLDVRVPALQIVKPGLLTTVQDLGRSGCERLGVPRGGALDPLALRIGNLLAGNDEGAAALEINDVGPEFVAADEVVIVFAGADLGARVDGVRVETWTAMRLAAGARVTFDGWQRAGHRAYVCVAGGVDVPCVLGSRATSVRAAFGGLHGRALRRGDLVPIGRARHAATARRCPGALRPSMDLDAPIGVVCDDRRRALGDAAFATFFATAWSVSRRSDRMGFRLDGARLPLAGPAGILSEPVPPGTLQVTGDGQPIALLADRQTTGGYTTLGVIASADLRRLAQRGPGEPVRFVAIGREDALARRRRDEALVAALRAHLAEER